MVRIKNIYTAAILQMHSYDHNSQTYELHFVIIGRVAVFFKRTFNAVAMGCIMRISMTFSTQDLTP